MNRPRPLPRMALYDACLLAQREPGLGIFGRRGSERRPPYDQTVARRD